MYPLLQDDVQLQNTYQSQQQLQTPLLQTLVTAVSDLTTELRELKLETEQLKLEIKSLKNNTK